MQRAMLDWVCVDKPIEVACQFAGYCGRATGAGAIHQALDTLVGEAMDPRAQCGIGKVQRVGNGLEAMPFDDVAHGSGTAEDAGLFGLLEQGIQGGESLIGKVKFEGPHGCASPPKVLHKTTTIDMSHDAFALSLEQSLFDSNFPGAAVTPSREGRQAVIKRRGYPDREAGLLTEDAAGHGQRTVNTLAHGLAVCRASKPAEARRISSPLRSQSREKSGASSRSPAVCIPISTNDKL